MWAGLHVSKLFACSSVKCSRRNKSGWSRKQRLGRQFDVGGLFCVGCLSRCLHAGALHSSHSQGFVPGMENDQLEGGKGLHAICAKLRLPEFIEETC